MGKTSVKEGAAKAAKQVTKGLREGR